MTHVVIDASALIALLLAEPGADKVRAVLADAAVSTINYAEIVGFFARHGASERAIHDMLDALPINLIQVDTDLAHAAGMMLPVTRPAGLSIGDRVCLALARHLGVPALTADRAWTGVAASVGVQITLVR